MNEKPRTPLAFSTKPVPMKLFATCEVDRTPPNCVPRMCSLTVTRLTVLKPLGSDVSSVLIAIKIQGSKRTLRSNEIPVPSNGNFETPLQLHFSFQYRHLLKRTGNRLHIFLQKKKKYKNRTFLGYKTLAHGKINMCLVLQKQLNLDLDLLSERKHKEHDTVVGRVTINCLNSQPIDFDVAANKSDPNAGDYSDEDTDLSSNDISDSDQMTLENRETQNVSRLPRNSVRQRNIKQKFISLLKKFRINEDFHNFDREREIISEKLKGSKIISAEIEDLFKEFELSDSTQDMDTQSSVSSAPKPSLRPYFSSTLSLSQEAISNTVSSCSYKPSESKEKREASSQSFLEN